MSDLNKKNYWLDWAGWALIGTCSLLYVLFYKFFAERHIQLPFLDFPIFAGEILLFTCLLLFCAKYWRNLPKLTKWHYVIIGYFVFVLVKALYGYMRWGPLALRHSALFYYPVFAIFSYVFYRREFIGRKMTLFFVLLIVSIFAYGEYYGYYLLTLTFLGFILIKSYPHKGARILVLLAFLVFLPYRSFFLTSRMMVVSNFATGVYLAATLSFILAAKRGVKLIVAGVIIGAVSLGLFKFTDNKSLKSIVDFKRMIDMVQYCNKKTDEYSHVFKLKPRPKAKFYNPDIGVQGQLVMQETDKAGMQGLGKSGKHPLGYTSKKEELVDQETVDKIKRLYIDPVYEKVKKDVIRQMDEAGVDYKIKLVDDEDRVEMIFNAINVRINRELDDIFIEFRKIAQGENIIAGSRGEENGYVQRILDEKIQLNDSTRKIVFEGIQEKILEDFRKDVGQAKFDEKKYYNDNAVFRILIWQDMVKELIKVKPVVGIDFGKPFRSTTLEMFRWGEGDWLRDGWIGAHNSHLHIIYRAGIVGLLWIFAYLSILFKMILRFIRRRSLTGILLCGIIVNWFVAANFLLILELPYSAIPIWTLFGLTYAYCYKDEALDMNVRGKK